MHSSCMFHWCKISLSGNGHRITRTAEKFLHQVAENVHKVMEEKVKFEHGQALTRIRKCEQPPEDEEKY